MKIGISTATFFSKETTEDTLSLITKMGIDICEVFLTTFREYEQEFVEMLKERKGKLEVYSIHTLNQQYEPELFNSVARTREDCEYFFKKAAYAAKILDAKYYTFHGPARLKRRPYIFNYEKIAKRLAELDEILYNIANGCKLAYENVHWTYFSEPSFFNGIKEHCQIHSCLDIKQAMQSGISSNDYIDCMGDRLVNVHLCDYDAKGNLTIPGRGIFDFVSMFRYLEQKNYSGPLMMELYAGDYTSYDEIMRGYDYLNDCLIKAKN